MLDHFKEVIGRYVFYKGKSRHHLHGAGFLLKGRIGEGSVSSPASFPATPFPVI